jgi:hypothetical protein
MLNGFATLPKPASEIEDGSNAPVSGDAVHDYVESKIPTQLTPIIKSSVVNATSNWTALTSALVFGNVVCLNINLRAENELSLPDTLQIGTLTGIPTPPRFRPITFIQNSERSPTPWLDCGYVMGYITENGYLGLCRQPNITIPQNEYLIGESIYVCYPF